MYAAVTRGDKYRRGLKECHHRVNTGIAVPRVTAAIDRATAQASRDFEGDLAPYSHQQPTETLRIAETIRDRVAARKRS